MHDRVPRLISSVYLYRLLLGILDSNIEYYTVVRVQSLQGCTQLCKKNPPREDHWIVLISFILSNILYFLPLFSLLFALSP